MKKGIIWSYTKGEFVIFDHYYFSTLYQHIKENFKLEIPTKFSELIKIADNQDFELIIFNYPEKPFTNSQINSILELFDKGKKILFLTYYKNEDNSSKIVNSVVTRVGMTINYDEVVELHENHRNDKYLITTSRVHGRLKDGVKKIVMPCTSTISIQKNNTYSYQVLVSTESGEKIIAAQAHKKGKIITFGTCVFWDNFSIHLYDNFQFTKNLINYCLEV